MSRTNKWIHFFEESSPKRDVESWWTPIKAKVLDLGVKVVGITSDRARALIKLGGKEYLDVFSMPDLFHFARDLGSAIGSRISAKREQVFKKYKQTTDKEQKTTLEQQYAQLNDCQQLYRQQSEQVNKTVHPFSEQDEWHTKQDIEQSLTKCFTKMADLANGVNIDVSLEKATKILHQISPIATAIQGWQTYCRDHLKRWAKQYAIPRSHHQAVQELILPYAYWQQQLNRTQAKKRNKELRIYYKERVLAAKQKWEQHLVYASLSKEQLQLYWDKANHLASTFQRSSSQVEGRNGYLAFLHHAHKGISKQRLAVLTVIHNFDTRRNDKTTPAERLFDRQFPDLFEFLCQNVTGFAEPRARKHKALINNSVQH